MSKPVEQYRQGGIKASLFEREVEGPNGKFVSQSVALQRSYKKNGEWINNSLTLVKKDIGNAIQVLTKAAEKCS